MAAVCCKIRGSLDFVSFNRLFSRSSAISSRFYNTVSTHNVCSRHKTDNTPISYPRSAAKLWRNSCDRASSFSSLETVNQRSVVLPNTRFLSAFLAPNRSSNKFFTTNGPQRPVISSTEAEKGTEKQAGGEGASLSPRSGETLTDFESVHMNSETEGTLFGQATRRERPEGVLAIDELVEELRGENAKDICVIKVPESLKYVEYLVIVSGSSTRHLRAIAQYIIKLHKDRKGSKDKFVTVEGAECDDWMAIDLGNIALHMMLPEIREKYELEKLWTLGSEYDDQSRAIDFLDLPFNLFDQFEILEKEEGD